MFPENALKEWKDPRAGVLPFCLKPEVSAHNSWNHLCVWTGLVIFLAQILLSLPSAAGDPHQHPHLFSKILAFATISKFSHIKLFHYNRKGLDSSFPFLLLQVSQILDHTLNRSSQTPVLNIWNQQLLAQSYEIIKIIIETFLQKKRKKKERWFHPVEETNQGRSDLDFALSWLFSPYQSSNVVNKGDFNRSSPINFTPQKISPEH
jgi:hypothetical protein